MNEQLMKHIREPPFPKNGSINVHVGMYLESLGAFKQTEMTFEVDIYLYMSWQDKSLAHFENGRDETWIINDDAHRKKIWVPDIYFANARKAQLQDVTVPNFNMYIHSNGTIAYSLRTTLTVACALDLRNYPMDSQVCNIVLLSYSHVEELVNVTWFTSTVPIKHNKRIALPELNLIATKPSICDGTYEYAPTATGSRTGVFSCLSANIYLSRSLMHNLLQTYIPLGGIVIVSWTSFWIDRRASPARVTLTFMTLVSLTSMGNGMRFALPQVSYAKAVDYYYFAAMIFVFGALIEFAFVNSYMRKSEKYEKLSTKYKDKDEKLLHSPIIFSAFQKSYDQMVRMRKKSNAVVFLENLKKRSRTENGSMGGRAVKFSFSNDYPPTDSDDSRKQSTETQYFSRDVLAEQNQDLNDSFYDNVPRIHPTNKTPLLLTVDGDLVTNPPRQSPSPQDSSMSSETQKEVIKKAKKERKISKVTPNPLLSTQYSEFSHMLSMRALNIDKWSRILFPLTFTMYNLIYWVFYISQRKDFVLEM
ncbi:hypothetical protein FO519_007247 [Halicephalobus sp. NKZ332]|nr:hypothetical protein FO519_007247 [Halicephalobus sp. NKZ332]